MKITVSYLKQLRRRKNLTQRELAEKAGFSQAHIAKIETGKTDPRLSTVNKILSVLEKGTRCGHIMSKNIISCSPQDKISDIARKMWDKNISQIPVMKNNNVLGTITDRIIVKTHDQKKTAKQVMEPSLPVFDASTEINTIKDFLMTNQAVLVSKKGEIKGIITRSDFMKIA